MTSFISRSVLVTVIKVLCILCLLTAICLPFALLCNKDTEDDNEAVWRWECQTSLCQKFRITVDTRDDALSQSACQLTCLQNAALWPKPTGQLTIGDYLVRLNLNSVDVLNPYADSPSGNRIRSATDRFKDILDKIESNGSRKSGGKSLEIVPDITDTDITRLALNLDESYTLTLQETSDDRVKAIISAANYFGFRHGLETLSQLVIYDDIRDEYQIVADAYIEDKPVYTYRGISLDTARNYVSVDIIKNTLEGMATSKLNTFHWHITDTHSFPYVSKSRPMLSRIGAYSRNKVYTPEDVADIIEYGLVRGVRVMPELDAPAHVGEGWQDTGFLTCFNSKPWQDYCQEPPCGQLDPTKEDLYDYLEGIYQDLIEQFDPDVFHMGGDEVSFHCWNKTASIVEWMEKEKGWQRSEEDFVKLWDIFQTNAAERYTKHARKNVPIILWDSKLTEADDAETYLPKDKYIIQIWTIANGPEIETILSKGYSIIVSNYEALYMDCGFGAWTASGNNWCSPYIGWQKVYDNSPEEIAGEYKNQVLGGEAVLWTEQADSSSVDGRLWPRAAALAERLWAEPADSWRSAEQRMLIQRERLVKRGIQADVLQPEWCVQNDDNCPRDGIFNT